MHTSIWFWEDLPYGQLKMMLDSLPPFRKEKALSYVFDRDRLLCAKSYLMLCEIMTEKYNISRSPDFAFGPNGKPYLKGVDKKFNISHCRKGILCAVGDVEVGCDIEEIFPELDMDLCRMCFNGEEIDVICSSRDPNMEFTRLWTQKEAYLKLTGEGLTDSLADILSESVISRVSFTTTLHLEQGCVSTIATYKGNV